MDEKYRRLLEFGLGCMMQIPANYVSGATFGLESMTLAKHGHGPWLMCEVALSSLHFGKTSISIIDFFDIFMVLNLHICVKCIIFSKKKVHERSWHSYPSIRIGMYALIVYAHMIPMIDGEGMTIGGHMTGHLWVVNMVLMSSKFLFVHGEVSKVSNGIRSPPLKRGHDTLYCITENHDQHKANGLTFTMLPKYRCYVFFFLFYWPQSSRRS